MWVISDRVIACHRVTPLEGMTPCSQQRMRRQVGGQRATSSHEQHVLHQILAYQVKREGGGGGDEMV